MKVPFHPGAEDDYRALEETRQDVRRWRFHCLVKHLCRKRGPLAWWGIHRAWRRICRRHDKSRVMGARG